MPRLYLQTPNEQTFRVVSLQSENTSFLNTDTRREFTVDINDQYHVRVWSRENNEVQIDGIDDIEFSFEIGYENYVMACLTYTVVPLEQQIAFGRDQIIVNNNWRITTGPDEYSLNLPVDILRVSEGRSPLFRVHLDHRLPEPHRISIRIRPGN